MDNDGVQALQTIVDLRLFEWDLALGRHIFQEEGGTPSRGDLRNRTHCNSIAVGELQVTIHPPLSLLR